MPVKKSISIDNCIDSIIRSIMAKLISMGYNARYSHVANMLMYLGAINIKSMNIEDAFRRMLLEGFNCKELEVVK